jgi:hypothetical protein
MGPGTRKLAEKFPLEKFIRKFDLISKGGQKLLLEQIRKLNCDGCRLRTEHYILSDGDALIACRCLKYGLLQKNVQLASASVDQPYPVDESRPIYVS